MTEKLALQADAVYMTKKYFRTITNFHTGPGLVNMTETHFRYFYCRGNKNLNISLEIHYLRGMAQNINTFGISLRPERKLQ